MGAVARQSFCNQFFPVKHIISMKPACLVFRLSLLILLFVVPMSRAHAQPAMTDKDAKSQWVSISGTGKLVYKTTEQGDKIMDFSHAGYMGGGVRLPEAPVKITLEAITGDNTAAIQQAINTVSAMPLVN